MGGLIDKLNVDKLDAVLVLGKGLASDNTPDSYLECRLDKSINLYRIHKHAGFSLPIIMSGKTGFHKADCDLTEACAMEEYAIGKGIDPSDIYKEEFSLETTGNAYFTKKEIIEPNSWKDIGVISNSFHMQRVEYVFRLIYGPDYNLEFISAKTPCNQSELKKLIKIEHIGLERTFNEMDEINPGDDDAVRKHLESFYPIKS